MSEIMLSYHCSICGHSTQINPQGCGRVDDCDLAAGGTAAHHHCAEGCRCTYGGCIPVAEPLCIECVEDGEDPAPWCDCQFGETCGDRGPCRRRAHDPARCPTPGRW